MVFLKIVGFSWKFALWVIWWCWFHFWFYFDPKKLLWPPWGHFNSLKYYEPLWYWFLKVVRFCWKSIHWVFRRCWIHFWCYFDPQKLLWPFRGILIPQNVKKRPMIFSRCLILLKFCTKLLWILIFSGEPIILCLKTFTIAVDRLLFKSNKH